VLAARMGGKAAPVAVIVTLQTCVFDRDVAGLVAMVSFSGIGRDLLLLPHPNPPPHAGEGIRVGLVPTLRVRAPTKTDDQRVRVARDDRR